MKNVTPPGQTIYFRKLLGFDFHTGRADLIDRRFIDDARLALEKLLIDRRAGQFVIPDDKGHPVRHFTG
jgi:hypothetical protein